MREVQLRQIKEKVSTGDYTFTFHAGVRMTERGIAVAEVGQALQSEIAEVIEHYPDDPRGPSCLVFGATMSGRILHIQCSYRQGVAVITAYEPNPDEWLNWRIRKGGA